jgi:Epoxide hydrolase N terminus
LRLRVAATRWPDKETVADHSQGVPLATFQELARYWAAGYDWRACESKLNALPQFMTEVDGLGSISSTPVQRTKMRCLLSSPTGGPAPS